MSERTTKDNPRSKYFQEEVKYYVREDGMFIPIYTRAKPKVEPPPEKVKEKPFNVDSYEIFKHENEYVYSSEEEFITDEEIMSDDYDDLGIAGLEEEVRDSKTDESSCAVSDADDECESEGDTTQTSETETCWDVDSALEADPESKSQKDPEEFKPLDLEKDLPPLMEDILNVHRERPVVKRWKPNPYKSTLVYRDKITESDKEDMQFQKELNRIKTDDLLIPSDNSDYEHPKPGDVNYMGEMPCDPNLPFIPWREMDPYNNKEFDFDEEVELWPKRDYQSDFVTDTSEPFSTVTEVDDEDLEHPHSIESDYPDIKEEEYMDPIELNAGEHQYEKIPGNQPEVRHWYDWHGDLYMDVKNAKGEWETVEKIRETYPLPKPKHSEHYWKKKGEEEGYYPPKCSPYEYPPDDDGYYHHCPGYKHIPGTENWSFYDNVKDYEKEKADDDGNDGGPSDNDEQEIISDKTKQENQITLKNWQDHVTQSLRNKDGSNENTSVDPKSTSLEVNKPSYDPNKTVEDTEKQYAKEENSKSVFKHAQKGEQTTNSKHVDPLTTNNDKSAKNERKMELKTPNCRNDNKSYFENSSVKSGKDLQLDNVITTTTINGQKHGQENTSDNGGDDDLGLPTNSSNEPELLRNTDDNSLTPKKPQPLRSLEKSVELEETEKFSGTDNFTERNFENKSVQKNNDKNSLSLKTLKLDSVLYENVNKGLVETNAFPGFNCIDIFNDHIDAKQKVLRKVPTTLENQNLLNSIN